MSPYLHGNQMAGKSTLLKLLLRLYDPHDGAVLIDGTDARDLDLGWLRRRCGYVPQQPVLFDASIADNVGFGAKETPSVDQLSRALETAGADEFVGSLPDGVETLVGEGGKKLSGGQKQRIAIARAVVSSPPVLLWDEATSSLDAQSERVVQRTLRSYGGRCTAVVVAHRLSSVMAADRVAVLIRGRIVEEGAPNVLAHAGGWFQRSFFPDGGGEGA